MDEQAAPGLPGPPNATRRLSAAVLATKLNPPLPNAAQIVRDTICNRVAGAASVKLVLVRGPAGFGKTTAMLQIRARLEEAGVETAWLTLDHADNDASRFASCLASAIAAFGVEEHSSAGALDIIEARRLFDVNFWGVVHGT